MCHLVAALLQVSQTHQQAAAALQTPLPCLQTETRAAAAASEQQQQQQQEAMSYRQLLLTLQCSWSWSEVLLVQQRCEACCTQRTWSQ
jgi:hypothetical protein